MTKPSGSSRTPRRGSKKDKLLQSVPDVGPTTSANLLAHLPELGAIDRKQVEALAGLGGVPRCGHRIVGSNRSLARMDCVAASGMIKKNAVHRHALTEEQWRRLQAVLPKQKAGPPATLGDRLFIEAVLFRAKTGMPWRDLPERFGPWKSVYNRFDNWAKKGRWELIFKALQLEVDEVGSIVDGSVVRAHQDASGGKGGSRAMPSVVLPEVFRPNSMPLSTRKAAPSTVRSRRGSGTR